MRAKKTKSHVNNLESKVTKKVLSLLKLLRAVDKIKVLQMMTKAIKTNKWKEVKMKVTVKNKSK